MEKNAMSMLLITAQRFEKGKAMEKVVRRRWGWWEYKAIQIWSPSIKGPDFRGLTLREEDSSENISPISVLWYSLNLLYIV